MSDIGDFFNNIFVFPMYNMLMLLDHTFHDFGISIIVLTLLIRLVLFPLTLKQLRSAKATQALQPRIAELKKRYANDQRAQQAAITALYKEHNFHPVAGCLPLLVQIPVLYGLYGAMHLALPGKGTVEAINLHLYPFVPHFTILPDFDLRWFTFLHASWVLPLTSLDATHLLPILAGLATFIQLRMSQARLPKTSEQKNMMAQQAQMMSFIMPFFTVFIAWNFPAGLALYWTISSIFSTVQQYFVTGWGSLFPIPAPGRALGVQIDENGSTSLGETRKEKETPNTIIDSDAEVLPEPNTRRKGPARASSSRRRRPSKVSARRSGNTPGRNLLQS
ncbi:MAG TPA: YidC/Oxa1 family membrane protein insertase [Ktedonobacteraceae bacterium]|nr:YidC/Oxa1 family membrane protein insertase [Ktedonobacteraceae bacterium]